MTTDKEYQSHSNLGPYKMYDLAHFSKNIKAEVLMVNGFSKPHVKTFLESVRRS